MLIVWLSLAPPAKARGNKAVVVAREDDEATMLNHADPGPAKLPAVEFRYRP